MKNKHTHYLLNILIAIVWLINGLFCKVLNLVPRHQEIVGEILGQSYSTLLTMVIGVAEICMAIWIISGIRSRVNAVVQIAVVLTMNILEFWLVPDLLLWGRLNLIFAVFFAALVYFNEFVLHPKLKQLK